MILVDTSVLIDWLKGNENPKTKVFDTVISSGALFAISILTYQEILQGAKNDSEYGKLKSYLGTQTIIYLPQEPSFYDEAANIYRQPRSSGKTIRSTVDVLIAMTAIVHEVALLHNDRDFDLLANELDGLEIVSA